MVGGWGKLYTIGKHSQDKDPSAVQLDTDRFSSPNNHVMHCLLHINDAQHAVTSRYTALHIHSELQKKRMHPIGTLAFKVYDVCCNSSNLFCVTKGVQHTS